jgi:MFS family permease
MLVPVGTAMVFRAFPPIERAKASTVLIVPTVLAPALGPVLGGWLVTDVSWRWIFYVNLPVGAIVSSQLVGRLYHRVGPRRLIVFGMLTMAAVTLPLAFIGLDTSLWEIRAIMFARGIAMAFAFVPMQAATYANISPADTGRASAIYSTQRQVAAALGVATLGTVLVSRINSANAGVTDPRALADGALSGYHLSLLVGTILVALASLSGLLIHDEDAASTMLSRTPQHDLCVELR